MSEQTDKRIGHVEREVAEIRGRLSGVEDKLGTVAGGVEKLSGGVEKLLRRDVERAAATPPSMKDLLAMAVHAAVLIGLAVSAIVYVAGGYYAADIAVLKLKVEQAMVGSGWRTQTERAVRR